VGFHDAMAWVNDWRPTRCQLATICRSTHREPSSSGLTVLALDAFQGWHPPGGHWKRDASQWREDACRLRRPKAARNFALPRNALLALIPQKLKPLIVAFEHYSRNLAAAIKLLQSKLPAGI